MDKKVSWPKVTFIFPTLNGGQGVRDCLESVKKQDYPKNKIEIIVIDNGSTDNSTAIAKKYTSKVLVSYKDGYTNRIEAMRMANGDFVFMILEQDLELAGKDFIKKMVWPMIEDKRIVASFAAYRPRKNQPWITRFISYDPQQADPMWEYLSYPLEKTFVEKRMGYTLCYYENNKIPIMGRMFYRVSYLKKTATWNMKKGSDQDEVRKVVKDGYHYFAFVPKPGIYHYHAKHLKEFLYKRIRNLHTHYFPDNKDLENRYVDITKKGEVLKLFLWVIYANSIVLPLLRGLYRSFKFKDWALLMEPVVTVSTTDLVLWNFLTNSVGRNIISQGVKTLIKREQ